MVFEFDHDLICISFYSDVHYWAFKGFCDKALPWPLSLDVEKVIAEADDTDRYFEIMGIK